MKRGLASLLGAVLLLAAGAAAQVPGQQPQTPKPKIETPPQLTTPLPTQPIHKKTSELVFVGSQKPVAPPVTKKTGELVFVGSQKPVFGPVTKKVTELVFVGSKKPAAPH